MLRRLYKNGLMDILRPWLALNQNIASDALIELTLEFLLNLWTNRVLISNYSFNIGKAIVKVKKNGNPECKSLAEKVQQHWTEILNGEDSKANNPSPSAPSSVVTPDNPSLSRQVSTDGDGDYISSLPIGMYYFIQYGIVIMIMNMKYEIAISNQNYNVDAVARNTRSRRPVISDEEIMIRKRVRLKTIVSERLLLL